MKVALIAFLCFPVLLHADSSTTEDPPSGECGDQSLVSLVVNLARELQKQDGQLQQQASQLQQGVNERQQQASQLQKQASQLQQQDSQLQQQASQLQQQDSQLQQQASKLQQQDSQLQQQASHLHQGAKERQQQSARMQKLQDELTKANADLTALSELQAKEGQQSSFRAVLRNKAVAANTPIRFDLEFATGLGGYNPHTGIYTAPVSGLYLFGFQLFPDGNFDFMPELYINGTVRIRSRPENKFDTSSAASSFFRLQKGDTVWLQTDIAGQYWDTSHSFLFGALISPEL